MTVEELLTCLKGLHPNMPVHIMSDDRIVSDVLFLIGMNEDKPLYFFASQADCEKRVQEQAQSEVEATNEEVTSNESEPATSDS